MERIYKDRDDAVMELAREKELKSSYVCKLGNKPYIADVCVNSWVFGGTCNCLSHQPVKFTGITESMYELYKD